MLLKKNAIFIESIFCHLHKVNRNWRGYFWDTSRSGKHVVQETHKCHSYGRLDWAYQFMSSIIAPFFFAAVVVAEFHNWQKCQQYPLHSTRAERRFFFNGWIIANISMCTHDDDEYVMCLCNIKTAKKEAQSSPIYRKSKANSSPKATNNKL